MTYVVVWEFDVPDARRDEFERTYGPAGPWHNLSRPAMATSAPSCCARARVPGT